MGEVTDTFEFGYTVQTKILAALITDREFTSQVLDSFEVNYFDSKPLQWLCDQTLAYFKEYKLTPTLEVFRVQISTLDKNSIFKKEVISTLSDVWKTIGADDSAFVKEKVKQFCINQEYKKFILRSVDLLTAQDFEGIGQELKSVLRKVQLDNDFGLEYLTDIDYRYTEEAMAQNIETPWSVINDLMNGGLPKKKLGIIIAPTGIGKCVGGNTEIEIQYEEIGIELSSGNILWMSPWEKVRINDVELFGWEVERLLQKQE